MTDEEKIKLERCRLLVIGSDPLTKEIDAEIRRIGFRQISHIDGGNIYPQLKNYDIVVEVVSNGSSVLAGIHSSALPVPIVYPFDFIEGAGTVVLRPGDSLDFARSGNLRPAIAEYFAGYCAFWHIDNNWLCEAIPLIRENNHSDEGMRSAAIQCSRIVASMAVGREVKYYLRFYLCRNSKQPAVGGGSNSL